MDTSLKPVTTGIKQGLNIKTLVTVIVIAVITILIIGLIMKQRVVLYDENGKATQEGEVKFTFKKFKKPVKS